MTFEARKHFLQIDNSLTLKFKITTLWSLGLEKNENNKKSSKTFFKILKHNLT